MLKFLRDKLHILTLVVYVTLPSLLYANNHITPAPTPGSSGSTQLNNPTTITSINALLTALLNFVVTLGTPVVTIAIIYAGFKFVAARGNTAKLDEAKTYLWYVLIGAAIILGAFVLENVITGTVGQIQSGVGS